MTNTADIENTARVVRSYEMADTKTPNQMLDRRSQDKIVAQQHPSSTVSNVPFEQIDENKRSTWRITLILVALFLSLFVSALDATIVSTAVPVISNDLHSASGYTWVGGAYLLANCAAGPIWAKMSDIWGRRPILLTALAIFIAGSIICATAKTMPTLIAGRAIQGAAGGAIILLVHICVSDLFSIRQRTLIMGLTEGVWALAGGIGPVLGGVFASLVSWRWCFWVNLPICGVSFILILLFLDIQHHHTSWSVGLKAVDWFGIIAFLGCTLMLLLGLDFGGAIFPWSSAKVISLLVVGSFLVLVFLWGEMRVAKYPLFPLTMFKNTSNVASLFVGFFHGMVFINSEYYLPLFFQSVLSKTPLISGVLLLPVTVGTAFAGIFSGVAIHRTGRFRELIWVGTLLQCVGGGLYLIWNPDVSLGTIVGVQIVSGIGAGLLFEPPLIAIQSQVQQRDMATATATFTFVRSVAITLSVIIGGTVFQNSMDGRSAYLAHAGLPQNIIEQLSGKNAAANVMIADTISNASQALAIRESFSWSIRNMFILFDVLAFCGVVASLFVKRSHLAQEHTEMATGIRVEPPQD